MKYIALSGGTGSGKSTVAYRLIDTYPDIFEVLNLDDYKKVGEPEKDLPKIDDMINWDHPDIINWNNLINDIKILSSNRPVTIQTWSHRSNPDYFIHRKMNPRTIYPKKVLIIEGHFSLWLNELRALYDMTFFLDLDHKTRMKRRKKFVDPVYDTRVLIPMHTKYIEPTKKFANIILDISTMNEDEVYKKIEKVLSRFIQK